MKRRLLDVLACPACGGDLDLGVDEQAGEEIVAGTLQCRACAADYSVIDGVPSLLLGREHEETREAFSEQWRLRQSSQFERNEMLYRHLPGPLVQWMFEECFGAPESGQWMLDAGCGSGHKTLHAARQHPELEVVGMDVADTLPITAKEMADQPNLHWVQGDVTHPPFKRTCLNKLLSWGVLHHTPNTYEAFRAVSDRMAEGGEVVLWIYPDPAEDDLAAKYYAVRDRHFLGKGNHIPPALLLPLVRTYCALMAPVLFWVYRRHFVPRYRDTSYVKLGTGHLYRTIVFTIYDCLIPEYQFRHARAEVKGWFERHGYTGIQTDGRGHYWGRRGRVADAAADEPVPSSE